MLANGKMLLEPMLQEVKLTKELTAKLEQEQFNLLGISFAKHPLSNIKYKGEYKLTPMSAINSNINTVGHSLVILLTFRNTKTKHGASMAFAKLEDEFSTFDVVIFPAIYEKIKNVLINNNIFIATLKSSERGLQLLDLKEYKHE
jgi:DNA polymerase-3 subunit alpha